MRAYERVRESLQFNFQYFCISSVFVSIEDGKLTLSL